jgi:hypothetical protein
MKLTKSQKLSIFFQAEKYYVKLATVVADVLELDKDGYEFILRRYYAVDSARMEVGEQTLTTVYVAGWLRKPVADVRSAFDLAFETVGEYPTFSLSDLTFIRSS